MSNKVKEYVMRNKNKSFGLAKPNFFITNKEKLIIKNKVNRLSDYKILQEDFLISSKKNLYSFIGVSIILVYINTYYIIVIIILYLFITYYKLVYLKALKEIYMSLLEQDAINKINQIVDYDYCSSINPEFIFKYIKLSKFITKKIYTNNYIKFKINDLEVEHCNIYLNGKYKKVYNRELEVYRFKGSILLIKKSFHTNSKFAMFTNYYFNKKFEIENMHRAENMDRIETKISVKTQIRDVHVFTEDDNLPSYVDKVIDFFDEIFEDFYVYDYEQYILVLLATSLFNTIDENYDSYDVNKNHYKEDMSYIEKIINLFN